LKFIARMGARALDLKKDNDWFGFKYDHFKNKTHPIN
jgi:hypothetical protein